MSHWTAAATAVLRERLADVEVDAASLSWADTSPWSARTHVTTERRVQGRDVPRDRIVRVDLHGLDRPTAEAACSAILDELGREGSPLGYVRLVVGRGRRSPDGRRVLAGLAEGLVQARGDALKVRSSTVGAPGGHLDLVVPGRWRPRARRTRRARLRR